MLAALGSAGVVLSRWTPWYSFRIPAVALDGAERLGILGPLIRQEAEAARALGTLHLTAWQAFQQLDVALVLAGLVGAALALLAYAGRATGTGRLIAWAGAVAFVLRVNRTIDPAGAGVCSCDP